MRITDEQKMIGNPWLVLMDTGHPLLVYYYCRFEYSFEATYFFFFHFNAAHRSKTADDTV